MCDPKAHASSHIFLLRALQALRSETTGFTSHLLAEMPWANYLTSLSFRLSRLPASGAFVRVWIAQEQLGHSMCREQPLRDLELHSHCHLRATSK